MHIKIVLEQEYQGWAKGKVLNVTSKKLQSMMEEGVEMQVRNRIKAITSTREYHFEKHKKPLGKMSKIELEKVAEQMGIDISECKNNGERIKKLRDK